VNWSPDPKPSGPRHVVALALDALRGMRRDQLLAAVLFGLVVSLVNAITFAAPLTTFARTLSITALVASILVQDQIRAFALTAAIVVADRAVDAGAPMRRTYLAAALGGCLLGVLLSEPAFWIWRASMPDDAWPAHFRWLHGNAVYVYHPVFTLTNWLVVGGATVFFYADRRAARRTEARLRAAELDRIRSSKLALESRLQAMQARVEPQFLFNTLAQVERLFEVDATLAARMLDDLIAYLRAAMPLMRDTSSTVAQEVELARAYLDIARLRLGERLRVAIDVPPEVGGERMPPMMLLPLIDHAIVRGLEPAATDGTIAIAARVGGGRLTLTIVDQGAGLVPDTEADGVAAIRQRLDALFRGDATLDLRRAGPHATRAVLELPLESRNPADDTCPSTG
jgi:hypothetical protein